MKFYYSTIDPFTVEISFNCKEDRDQWIKEQEINNQVDEALKDYESNPRCGNQCNSKPI